MLVSVQALRALAAWVVVFHHVMQVFFDFQADSFVGRLFAERGAVGVDIFFVISGLVIYLSTQGKSITPWRFMLNRVLRIVPAYWLYSLIAALIIAFVNPVMPVQEFDLHHLLLSLFFIPAENPGGFGLYPTLNVGWTLNYEMFFYLLFALAFVFTERLRLLFIVLALAAFSLLATQPWMSDFYRNSIVYEFVLGVCLGVIYKRGWIRQGLWLPLLVISAALLTIYHFDNSMRLLHWGVPSVLIVAACIAMEPWFRGNRLFSHMGDCSYSVYLLHVIVLSLGWYLQARLDLEPTLVIAACIPVIAVAAWGSYELIEKRFFVRAKLWVGQRTDSGRLQSLS
ncbi:Peptidoglycan/LPS O-acetylase OafA/YrhL, contains acyltransferase and SGNH-hydrolase domains [Ectopseudomonas composti]|uniref:Peptidoglycan/LPS O-acetylase OafA/YrhL, contains acyltransferase and SGNH-hydrolase domains n=1 Tax=Ectopseudomonas composti TaxID=658457 RepID=A0A1I5L879_9GAMM|nr:acyltransferase [Pseudomonas composti]SFO93490.1 Peptidoglycan/LPS O-acetylase OafA/YrhL, contains acyltransferase and SGNH-hydrolase domains [Pseudomonas composti]